MRSTVELPGKALDYLDRSDAKRTCESTVLEDSETTHCEIWVNQDRLSGGQTQPDERPAGMPDRNGATRMCEGIVLKDSERTRCEIWTRVMGYHRPVAAWNAGKQSEHRDRRYFRETRTAT